MMSRKILFHTVKRIIITKLFAFRILFLQSPKQPFLRQF